MKYKSCPASFKAPPSMLDGDEPEFEAIVSVFNNPDSVGDVVRPGAFKDSLAAWKQAGDPIPVLWSHRMDDPMYNIGAVKDIEELAPGDERIPEWAHPWVKDNGGLWVKAGLDSGPDSSPIAVQARHLLMKRRVTQFSYAYDVLDERPSKDGFNELLKLWLYEVSPTQIGANELTELVGAKARARPPVKANDDPPSPPRRPSPVAIRLRCDLEIAAYSLSD